MTSLETLSGLPPLEPLPAVDWALVRTLRRAVAERLTKELPSLSRGAALSPSDVRVLGRSLIAAELADHVTGEVRAGRPAPTLAAEDALADAVFAAIFGLGRLQPLIDDPQVENIDVDGHDQVWIS